ncbi:MAG: PqqD family protein, partial [Chloroflexota bacterium]
MPEQSSRNGIKSAFRRLKARFAGPPDSGAGSAHHDLPAPGLYHYTRQDGGERSRLHLRLDPGEGGQAPAGILLVNASRVLHLNPTAAMMAYLVLENVPENQAVQTLKRVYRISAQHARSDYQQFCAQLEELVRPDGACPICEL